MSATLSCYKLYANDWHLICVLKKCKGKPFSTSKSATRTMMRPWVAEAPVKQFRLLLFIARTSINAGAKNHLFGAGHVASAAVASDDGLYKSFSSLSLSLCCKEKEKYRNQRLLYISTIMPYIYIYKATGWRGLRWQDPSLFFAKSKRRCQALI